MNLTDQVVSLSLAKKLKELGVKQEGWVWWDIGHDSLIQTDDGTAPTFYSGDGRRKGGGRYLTDMNRVAAAFTVAELGEMLPQFYYNADGEEHELRMHRTKDWLIEYVNHQEQVVSVWTEGDTEAEARGLMLAYLIENKLISV